MTAPQFMYAVGGALIGGAIGFLIGEAAIEAKVREEYEQSAAAYRRAMEISRINMLAENVQPPAPTEEDLEGYEPELVVTKGVDEKSVKVEIPDGLKIEHLVPIRPEDHKGNPNPYHIPVTAEETSIDAFVDGVANSEGIAYIEEEEFHNNDDERFKGQIVISMDTENQPSFFMGGIMIHDWAQRVGTSILADMLTRVPHGVDPVLYVRNHRTDEDYEVLYEVP